MTRTAPVTAVEQSSQALIERLEYGKFCASKDGPIEPQAEHGTLGATPGFPSEARELCSPRKLGLGTPAEQSALLSSPGHGTVLRPVNGSQLWAACYRIGTRSEGGDREGDSRRYVVGQYRIGGSLTPPTALFKSLAGVTGFTRRMAETLQPIACSADPGAPVEVANHSFLPEALTYVLSGIGIRIDADEAEFFQLVDLLWHALPETARPLLSAGWNIGASLARALIVSHASTASAGERPLYVARSKSWKVTAEFAAPDLFPGHMFLFSQFKIGACPAAYHEKIQAPGALSQLPDLADPAVRLTLRRFGLLQRDGYMSGTLKEWLARSESTEVTQDDLGAAAQTLLQGPERASFLEWWATANDEAAFDPRRRRQLTWMLLQNDPAAVSCPGCEPDKSNLAWFRMLLANDVKGSLRTYLEAPEAEEFLNQEAAARWEQLLDASLQEPDCAEYLGPLIQAGRGGQFGRWAARNATTLAIYLAHEAVWNELASTYRLEAAAANAMARLAAFEPPVEDDCRWISALGEENQRRLAAWIEEMWNTPNAGLLRWAQCLPFACFKDSLLKIAAGGSLDADETRACVRRAQGLLSESGLGALLAQEALRHVDELRETIEAQPQDWQEIMAFWPPEVRITVADVACWMPSRQPAARWSPEPQDLQERIEFWFSRGVLSACGRIRATAIVDACKETAPLSRDALSAVEICGSLARGEFLAGEPARDEDRILAARVLQAAASLPPDFIREAWSRAAQPWHLRLLLEVSGFSGELVPTPRHLSALIPERQWLRQRLAHVSPAVRSQFQIAAYNFHEASYQANWEDWEDRYRSSPLWAAFHGLPENHRGSLANALRAYCSSLPEEAACCLTHLNLHPDEQARAEVLTAFIFPRLREMPVAAAIRTLMAMARGVGNQQARGSRLLELFRKEPEIQMELALEPEADFLRSISRTRMHVAEPVFTLMWKLLRDPLLPRALERIGKDANA